MKTEQKHKILIWTVILSGLLNVTILATIFVRNYFTVNTLDPVENQDAYSKEAATLSGRFFRNQLALTPAQMRQFRQINERFRPGATEITRELLNCRVRLFEEMKKESPDTVLIRQYSEEIGKQHSRLKMITCTYYFDLKEIADLNQKQKLDQLFGRIFLSDSQFGGRGGGNQSGRQGRRILRDSLHRVPAQ